MKLLDTDAQEEALRRASRIAVLGIKPQDRAGQPAADIPAYLQEAGYEVIPVPVRYPEVEEILGRPVVRDLAAVPRPVDILDVFQKPEDVPAHLDAMLELKPAIVWFQTGCYHPASAAKLDEAGIGVVHGCIQQVHRTMAPPGPSGNI